MHAGGDIDFGRTAEDYRKFRSEFPDRFFARIAEHGLGRPGQRVLDIGTGTGALARGFARRGCGVTALDRSAELLDEARQIDAKEGISVRYVHAKAENTFLPDASFDLISAGQVWHLVDRRAVAREARRLLVPGGALVIAQLNWLAKGDNVVARTESLIERFNPQWRLRAGASVLPEWTLDVSSAGFGEIETFSIDLTVSFDHAAWRGRVRASAGVAASLPLPLVEALDAELADLLNRDFPAEPIKIPHRLFVLTARAP